MSSDAEKARWRARTEKEFSPSEARPEVDAAKSEQSPEIVAPGPEQPSPVVTDAPASSRNLTEVVNTKLSPEDAEMLKQEAKRRGFTELAPFVRELILNSLTLPTPTTLILETLLQLQYGVYEIAKAQADGVPLPAARITAMEKKLEASGPTLLEGLMHRRKGLL